MRISKWIIFGICILLLTGFLTSVQAEDDSDPENYCFSTLVLILPSETSWLADMIENENLTASGIFLGLAGIPHIEPNLAGYDKIFKGLDRAGGTLVGLPRCVQAFGLDAGGKARYSMEYFEPAGDGTYELYTSETNESPGLTVSVVAAPRPDSDPEDPVYTVQYTIEIILLEKREPIPDVNLNVGKPQVTTQTIEEEATFQENQWQLMAALSATTISTGNDDTILVLGHIIPVEPPRIAN